jgi:hypothetical protein
LAPLLPPQVSGILSWLLFALMARRATHQARRIVTSRGVACMDVDGP